jgi:signal transduction histidine kinase
VESVAVLLQRPLRDKSVSLSKQFLTEAQISAFPAEMRQVASNLITNAIDAVEPGGHIAVTVEDVVTKNSRPGVALVVADNGIGISKQDLPRLFRPFFTTKGENGTGLGLWITQGIVSKQNGYIEVVSDTSPERHGTTFRVTFPRLGTELAD